MLFKKRKPSGNAGDSSATRYAITLEEVEQLRRYAEGQAGSTVSDIIAVYDFAIRAIGKDMAADAACQLFRGNHCPYSKDYQIPFLLRGSEENILFSGNEVVAPVWSAAKWTSAVSSDMQSGFRQSFGNYTALFYKELKLIVITNGIHHSSVAALMSVGSAKVTTIRLSDYFDKVQTDGAMWRYNSDAGLQTEPVRDYRIAVLYELARRRAELAGELELRPPEEAEVPQEVDEYYDRLVAAQNKVRYWKQECELLKNQLKMLQVQAEK